MGEFDAIRPYDDAEVPAVLARLLSDPAFLDILTHFRFPRAAGALGWLLKPLIARRLRKEFAGVTCVSTLQDKVEYYVDQTIDRATDGVTYSGVEQLKAGTAYLFLANHRDIVMDPAFVNYAVYHAGLPTPRIAIGDNLLRKPCATELMKLNKSFIVKRSAKGPREMMKALGELSAYIGQSVHEGHSIWIAQKEGRAKDGDDKTDPAILKMFYVDGKKQKIDFVDYMRSLNIVPVSISYELDPTDKAKARELYEKSVNGSYEKGEFEDIESIVAGIVGQKGRVHVSFGAPITAGFSDPDELAALIDKAIWSSYRLFPGNYLAADVPGKASTIEQSAFLTRQSEVPQEHKAIWRAMYAKPVENAGKV